MTAADPNVIRHERDYLQRTIATVRNHKGADNCWPQWANIFADEIERCWAALDALEENGWRDQGTARIIESYESALAAVRADLAEARQRAATLEQQSSLDMGRAVGWEHRALAAEAALAEAREALRTVRAECDLPEHIAEIVGRALASEGGEETLTEPDREAGMPGPEGRALLPIRKDGNPSGSVSAASSAADKTAGAGC